MDLGIGTATVEEAAAVGFHEALGLARRDIVVFWRFLGEDSR